MNPIETYEWLVADEGFAYCPLGYGYTNYSRDGYRKRLLRYANIPSLGDRGPRGSTIGGAGIAVSAKCKSPETAVDYAFWIASADCQRGLYFDSGGQPGNAVAWDDSHCNAIAHNFFRDTRATLDSVYLRPRYDGYMNFQDAGGDIVNAFLARQMNADTAVTELEREYEQSVLVPSPGTPGEGEETGDTR
jgi:multiple sugar transport system substrate-binding protein